MQKRCLVVSYGPVPTPENQIIEGGGMRVWGLAKGLLSHGIETAVAVNSGFPLERTELDGITLLNWDLNEDFIQTLNSYDAVIVSYCMGDLSTFITDNIRDDIQLILDAYVPIYIEVSARDTNNMRDEYINYTADLARHNHTLRRGDYFLYANAAQEQLYTGVLAALGVINPYSYKTPRLLYTPFGLHRDTPLPSSNPYYELGITDDDFVVLWFGGLYPWFRVDEYLAAIKTLSVDTTIKFVFVGGKNPFNDNADLARQYALAVDFAHTQQLIDSTVYFVDWIDFDTRINWFKYADIIVSLNQPGQENKYSWRTRVMDFVWGEAATITNGGDPLSDEMVSSKAAIRIDTLSSEAITEALVTAKNNPKKVARIRENVKKIKKQYYWDTVTSPLAEVITQADHPYNNEAKLRALLPATNHAALVTTHHSLHPLRVVRKIRAKGLRRSLSVAKAMAHTQLQQTRNRNRQFVFISHPLDTTGAPTVLLQIIEEYVAKYGASRVRVFAPGASSSTLDRLRTMGLKVEKTVYGASFRFIRLQLRLRPDDFVFINTIAIYDSYRDFVLLWLKLKRLKHAYWFIHEDVAQIPVISPQFTEKQNIGAIKALIESKRLDLLFPSKMTRQSYFNTFALEGRSVRLNISVPKTYRTTKSVSDFDVINILLSGTSSDGRKGQLLALSALQDYLADPSISNPSAYRGIHLHLVAVGETDYISQQIRWIASSALKSYVTIHDTLPHQKALAIARDCNVTLCCSLNETFGIYVAEGMAMGHIILRNKTAGVDEQLIDGENGLLIDSSNIKDISRAFSVLTNKQTSATKLAQMSVRSQQIIKPYLHVNYRLQIENHET